MGKITDFIAPPEFRGGTDLQEASEQYVKNHAPYQIHWIRGIIGLVVGAILFFTIEVRYEISDLWLAVIIICAPVLWTVPMFAAELLDQENRNELLIDDPDWFRVAWLEWRPLRRILVVLFMLGAGAAWVLTRQNEPLPDLPTTGAAVTNVVESDTATTIPTSSVIVEGETYRAATADGGNIDIPVQAADLLIRESVSARNPEYLRLPEGFVYEPTGYTDWVVKSYVSGDEGSSGATSSATLNATIGVYATEAADRITIPVTLTLGEQGWVINE